MKSSSLERETITFFSQSEHTASIFAYHPAMQKQFTELCAAYPDHVCQTTENDFGGLTFELSKKWLRVVPPRVLSPHRVR